jgi:hypothetical protein
LVKHLMVWNHAFGQRYCVISFIIAKSTLRCSFRDTVASLRRSGLTPAAFALVVGVFFCAAAGPALELDGSAAMGWFWLGFPPDEASTLCSFRKGEPAVNIRICGARPKQVGRPRRGNVEGELTKRRPPSWHCGHIALAIMARQGVSSMRNAECSLIEYLFLSNTHHAG